MTRPLSILLVEDNPGDVRLTLEALKGWSTPPEIRLAFDGVEALRLLTDGYDAVLGPDLIILDLNLPKLSGREVLRRIKASRELRHIPVVVLSSSESDEDVRAAYDLHANCYVVKPVYLDEYLDVVRSIEDFWLARIKVAGNNGG